MARGVATKACFPVEMTRSLERQLRLGVESLRREYEATGRRAMPTILAS